MNVIDAGIREFYFGTTYLEMSEAMQELETQLKVLGKKIRIFFIDLTRSLPERLGTGMKKLGNLLTDAFRVETLEDYTQAAAIYGEELAGSLYQLQNSLTGLKIAVIQAAAPIVQVLLPVVQTAIQALTGLAQSIGYVFRMLFLGTAEVEDYANETQGAVTATKALKRSLAGFDQINRLADPNSGGGVVSGGVFDTNTVKPLSDAWKKLGDKRLELLEPLKKIDLTPAAESLERLVEAVKPITRALFAGLEWAWYNIFVPLAEWAVEELLPVFLDTLAAALENLAVIIEQLKPYFVWLWEECLKPWAEWKGSQLIEDIKNFKDQLTGVSNWAGTNKTFVDSMVESGKELATVLGLLAQESMGVTDISDKLSDALKQTFLTLGAMASPFQTAVASTGLLTYSLRSLADMFFQVDTASGKAWGTIRDIAGSGWSELKSKFLDPFNTGIRQSFNSTVNLLNGLMDNMEMVLNSVAGTIDSIFSAFSGVFPGFSSSGSKGAVSFPTIPKLAKGAVLPANKPFMAVVGDQRHGTNVEAPLGVIQEAVATVMGDYAAGNMAGHQATVSVLQELLSAVLGISIGDEVIASAVDRYERKMAVVKGGL